MGSSYRACYCHRRGGHFICRAGQIEAQLIVETGTLIDDDTAFGGVEISIRTAGIFWRTDPQVIV
jgi:hypothetical protein